MPPPPPPVTLVHTDRRAYVRQARTDDIGILAAIDGHCFAEPWNEKEYRQFITRRAKGGISPQIHVAAVNARIVGIAVLERGRTVCRLLRIGVLPDFRRSGVGTSLIEAAAMYAMSCASPRRRIVALSSEQATQSHAFLRRSGFKATNVYSLQGWRPSDSPLGYRGDIYHFVRTLAQ